MVSFIFLTDPPHNEYYTRFRKLWMSMFPETTQLTRLITSEQLKDILYENPTMSKTIFAPIEFKLDRAMPGHIVGVGSSTFPNGVEIAAPRHLLYYDTFIVPTPSVGYEIQRWLPHRTVRVVPPHMNLSHLSPVPRMTKTKRLELLCQIMNQPNVNTETQVILTDSDSLPNLQMVLRTPNFSPFWVIFTTDTQDSVQDTTNQAMDLGLSPEQYCLVKVPDESVETCLNTFLAVSDWVFYTPTDKPISWTLLLQSQFQGIPVIIQDNIRFRDYLLLGDTITTDTTIIDILDKVQQIPAGRRLTLMSSVRALVASTMTDISIQPKLQELYQHFHQPHNLYFPPPTFDNVNDSTGDCDHHYSNSNDSSNSGNDSDSDSSYHSNSGNSSNGIDTDDDKHINELSCRFGSPIPLNYQKLQHYLNSSTIPDGTWVKWASDGDIIGSYEVITNIRQYQLEGFQWICSVKDSPPIVQKCEQTRQFIKWLLESTHKSLYDGLVSYQNKNFRYLDECSNITDTIFQLVGRQLATSEGSIYFSWANRCLFHHQWYSYTTNLDSVEIKMPSDQHFYIKLLPEVVSANTVMLL